MPEKYLHFYCHCWSRNTFRQSLSRHVSVTYNLVIYQKPAEAYVSVIAVLD